MSTSQFKSEVLLRQAKAGDAAAATELLTRYRDRLRQMVSMRLDPGLRRRVDASDVVQDALFEASRRLPEYSDENSIPFYAWLRQIACDEMSRLREHHILTQKRSIWREVHSSNLHLPDESVIRLTEQLAGSISGPIQKAMRLEMCARVRKVLDDMTPDDRDILVMRHLEHLTMAEIAAIVGLTEPGVKSRYRRALIRLSRILSASSGEFTV